MNKHSSKDHDISSSDDEDGRKSAFNHQRKKQKSKDTSSGLGVSGCSKNATSNKQEAKDNRRAHSEDNLSPYASPWGVFLTKSPLLKSEWNKSNTISLQELVQPFQMVTDLYIFNYLYDVTWMLEQFDEANGGSSSWRDRISLTLVHGMKEPLYIKAFENASKKFGFKAFLGVTQDAFGVHHTKMFVIRYSFGKIRIAISTSNMVDSDWDRKTQGVWLSPLLPEADAGTSAESPTEFKKDFLEYLQSYRHRMLDPLVSIVEKHDFSQIRVYLLPSVPGRHTGDKLHRFGHMKLRKILSKHATAEGDLVVAQCSSIGSLGGSAQNWLTGELLTSFCPEAGVLGRRPRLKLVYPSHGDVRNSYGDLTDGDGLPYSMSVHLRQAWLNNHMCRWVADVSGRTQLMPHIKTYTRLASNNPAGLSWLALTSANVSKAAWGGLEKQAKQLHIRHYELGVLLLPTLVTEMQSTTLPLKTRPHSSGLHLLPFDFPLTPYSESDRPFFVDDLK